MHGSRWSTRWLLVALTTVGALTPLGCGSRSTNVPVDAGDEEPIADANTTEFPDSTVFPTPVCGDSTLDPLEGCDDGNIISDDGCSSICEREPNFACLVPGEACVSTVVCGDSLITGDEACDDGNLVDGDGCSAVCTLQAGWSCPFAGIRCVAAECGDAIVAGFEDCDDGNSVVPGCSADCTLEEGFACDLPDGTCRPTVCGDAMVEGTEQCDDQNNDLGDGCTPFCRAEPMCADGTCTPVCGDGIRLPGEACDDGNLRNFDGCSSLCVIEDGFACDDQAPAAVTNVSIPIVYRDFVGWDLLGTFAGAHKDFQRGSGAEAVGAVVGPMLGADGKPIYVGGMGTTTTHGATAFNQWYRDTVNVNRTVLDQLSLPVQGDGSYVFDSSNFFPLDSRGWRAASYPGDMLTYIEPLRDNNHNFHFTSELRYWFTYAGGEILSFRGDDDVYVFINKHRAIDLGGVHSPKDGSITLNAAAATTLDLTVGGIYEVVVFQAERQTSGSNYRLTLRGFNAPKSLCESTCGDSVIASDEACDDGINDGSYGTCNPGCQSRAPFCGDGVTTMPEQCDDGVNSGGYNNCAPLCVLGPRCGDGIIQPGTGEQCDDGNVISGDGCSATCTTPID